MKYKPDVSTTTINTGVDKLNQFVSFLHKSVKWWRKVFFWIFEVAVINAYIVYKKLALTTAYETQRVLIDYLSAPLRSQVPQRAGQHPPADQNLEQW